MEITLRFVNKFNNQTSGIKNIIFDFDGTLADTSKLIIATMQESIKDIDLPYRSTEKIKSTIGVRLEEIPSILWPEKDGLGESFANIYRKNFEVLKDKFSIELFPNVMDILSLLKNKGCGMAIATSRSQKSVEELTEQLGILDNFKYLLGGDNVEKGKPNPESIFKILRKMNWNSEDTIMVGDMAVDILMGKNAGIRTCGVTYGNGKEKELKDAEADSIITSFSELEEILRRINPFKHGN